MERLNVESHSIVQFFPTESSKFSLFFLMFRREAAAKHMLLASQSPKYLGMDIELMKKLLNVVAYNLAKSRTARDGEKKKDQKVPYLKVGSNVLVKDHTVGAFQPKYKDFCIVKVLTKYRVIVKDNHGTTTIVHRKDKRR